MIIPTVLQRYCQIQFYFVVSEIFWFKSFTQNTSSTKKGQQLFLEVSPEPRVYSLYWVKTLSDSDFVYKLNQQSKIPFQRNKFRRFVKIVLTGKKGTVFFFGSSISPITLKKSLIFSEPQFPHL